MSSFSRACGNQTCMYLILLISVIVDCDFRYFLCTFSLSYILYSIFYKNLKHVHATNMQNQKFAVTFSRNCMSIMGNPALRKTFTRHPQLCPFSLCLKCKINGKFFLSVCVGWHRDHTQCAERSVHAFPAASLREYVTCVYHTPGCVLGGAHSGAHLCGRKSHIEGLPYKNTLFLS